MIQNDSDDTILYGFPGVRNVKYLTFLGLKPNSAFQEEGPTLLTYAIQHDMPRVFEYLLKNGLDPFGKDKVGQAILSHAPKNSFYYSILLGYQLTHATKHDNSSLVRELLENGADVNFQDHHGDFALLLSVKQKNKPMINLILKYKPNFYLLNYDWEGVFDSNEDTEIIELLLSQKNILGNSKRHRFYQNHIDKDVL